MNYQIDFWTEPRSFFAVVLDLKPKDSIVPFWLFASPPGHSGHEHNLLVTFELQIKAFMANQNIGDLDSVPHN
jgi:hypothetical protein